MGNWGIEKRSKLPQLCSQQVEKPRFKPRSSACGTQPLTCYWLLSLWVYHAHHNKWFYPLEDERNICVMQLQNKAILVNALFSVIYAFRQIFSSACCEYCLEEIKIGKVSQWYVKPASLPFSPQLNRELLGTLWCSSPQGLTWNLTHNNCQTNEWKRLIGQDCLAGIWTMLHTKFFLSERKRLLHHVGVVAPFKQV